jgi:hypothetical protein
VARPDLFVATAEQEIASHAYKGRGAETDASHFIGMNVAVMAIIAVMVGVGPKGNGKDHQSKVKGQFSHGLLHLDELAQ